MSGSTSEVWRWKSVCVWGGGGGGLHTICSHNSRVDKKKKILFCFHWAFQPSSVAHFRVTPGPHSKQQLPACLSSHLWCSHCWLRHGQSQLPFLSRPDGEQAIIYPFPPRTTRGLSYLPLLVVHCHKTAIFPFRALRESSGQFSRLQATLPRPGTAETQHQ